MGCAAATLVRPTSVPPIRGYSKDVCYLDEAAFHEPTYLIGPFLSRDVPVVLDISWVPQPIDPNCVIRHPS